MSYESLIEKLEAVKHDNPCHLRGIGFNEGLESAIDIVSQQQAEPCSMNHSEIAQQAYFLGQGSMGDASARKDEGYAQSVPQTSPNQFREVAGMVGKLEPIDHFLEAIRDGAYSVSDELMTTASEHLHELRGIVRQYQAEQNILAAIDAPPIDVPNDEEGYWKWLKSPQSSEIPVNAGDSGQPGSGHCTPQLSSVANPQMNLQSAPVANPAPATTEQPDDSTLLQDIMALRKHGSAIVDSLEGLKGEYMVKYASQLFDLQWWEIAKTRIDNWKRYIRALDRDGVRALESSNRQGLLDSWQPIETAPKDTPGCLLFWLADEGFPVKARWTKPPLDETAEECWWCFEMDCTLDFCGNVTHWMHMPIPPEQGWRG